MKPVFLYFLLALSMTANISASYAQTSGRITSVEAFASPGAVRGCTNAVKVITFTAYVTASGPCTAPYKWLRSDNAIDKNANVLVFTAAGTKKITTTWTMTVSQYEGWEAVQFVQPNSITSNKAAFTIYCCPQANPCADNPYVITPGGESILKSFQSLVAKTNIKSCGTNMISYNGEMSETYYNLGKGGTDIMDYGAYYRTDLTTFGVVFGSQDYKPNGYTYVGVCPPSHPIRFKGPENHGYEAYLIPVDKYKAASATIKQDWTQLKLLGIPPVTMQSIVSWYYEPKTGYVATTDPEVYNSSVSSGGLIVKVKLKSGAEVLTYLRSNNEKDAITWKKANRCPN